MAEDRDSPSPARKPIPWFDDPSIQQELWKACTAAEQAAREKGAQDRDLIVFHLQSAAGLMGCEVWELRDKLEAAGQPA